MEQKVIPSLTIFWMYPDILNLHGDRGNMMALFHIAQMLGVEMEIKRINSPDEIVHFSQADLLFFGSGEIRCQPLIIEALSKQIAGLEAYLSEKKPILTVGNSGCLFAKKTARFGNEEDFLGLGLLDMVCLEREKVYGDDIWFELDGSIFFTGQKLEIIGNQIQIIDTKLGSNARPLGKIIYGRGNCGETDEGACQNNIIFTNTLGPFLVKNPLFAQLLIEIMLQNKQLTLSHTLENQDIVCEINSAELIKKFNRQKMNG